MRHVLTVYKALLFSAIFLILSFVLLFSVGCNSSECIHTDSPIINTEPDPKQNEPQHNDPDELTLHTDEDNIKENEEENINNEDKDEPKTITLLFRSDFPCSIDIFVKRNNKVSYVETVNLVDKSAYILSDVTNCDEITFEGKNLKVYPNNITPYKNEDCYELSTYFEIKGICYNEFNIPVSDVEIYTDNFSTISNYDGSFHIFVKLNETITFIFRTESFGEHIVLHFVTTISEIFIQP